MTDETRETRERTLVIHPLLFAVYPVLFLFSQNIRQFRLSVILEPLGVLLVAAAVLWTVLGLVLRHARKAAIIVSLSYLLFFSYELIRNVLPQFTWVVWKGFNIGPGKVTVAGLGLVFLAVLVPTVLTKRDLRKLTRVINGVAVVLVLLPVFSIMTFELGSRQRNLKISGERPAWDNAPIPDDPSGFPDIYYIICDAYTRDDILREYYGYDNRYFLEWLEQQGFYVAREGCTNHNDTALSLAASLNMTPAPDLVEEMGAACADTASMTEAIRNNRVMRFLKRRGYQTVAFWTSYVVTDMTYADAFLTDVGWWGAEFKNGLLEMTPVVRVVKKLSRNEKRRRQILSTLEGLKVVASRRSPKFVYAHVMAPHRPFVFGPNGEPVDPPHLYPPGGPEWPGEKERADYQKFYADQLTFLNKKLMEVVVGIKENSTVPPIIVIQGDHGACSLIPDFDHPTVEGLRERMSILNAYHLPSGGNELLYPGITPVNSFRVIFNHYFGTRLPLLEDRSTYKPPSHRHFVDVTDSVRGARLGEGK